MQETPSHDGSRFHSLRVVLLHWSLSWKEWKWFLYPMLSACFVWFWCLMAAYHLTGQDSLVKKAWLAVLALPVWHGPVVLLVVFAIPLYIAHIVYVGASNREDGLGGAVDKMSGTAARMTLFVAILITVATGLLPLADFARFRPITAVPG